jgi:two-component system OmpR family sensor kinase
MSRLGIRRRLYLVVLVPVAFAIAALVLGFNLILGSWLDRDARDLARARANAQLGLVTTSHGRLAVREAPDDAAADAYVWLFSGRRAVEQPRAGRQADAAARALADGPARFVDIPTIDVRLYATPVVIDGRRLGTVVVGVSLAPYEATRRLALIASLAFAAGVLLTVAVAARSLVRSSLRPVRRMTRQAAAWSDHDLDQRFGLGDPHDELTELAGTLDQLLERLASSLRREQRFSAELSHELRTPLAVVLAESELALRRERTAAEYRAALELVNRNAAQLTRTVDVLLAAARHEGGFERGTADAYEIASAAAAACSHVASERNLDVRLAQPNPPLRVGIDAELGERIVQPVLDNACRYATTTITVTIRRVNGAICFTVDDDGTGVRVEDRERIFEPGVRLGSDARNANGAGLGLALARRLAASVSGNLTVGDVATGARFLITLPSA